MHIVQNIAIPGDPLVSSLYFKGGNPRFAAGEADKSSVNLRKGETFSLNSFFNSFFEGFYVKYSALESLYYTLFLRGSFELAIYRDKIEQERQILSVKNIDSASELTPVKINLPDLRKDSKKGRIYVEMTCRGEEGIFYGGHVCTDQDKSQDIKLAIVICTYKREDSVVQVVNGILKDSRLKDKDFKIFLVDNANSLNGDNFIDQKISLIGNKNYGGSGGFSRGIIQALDEGGYTHFLLMDDDVEVESESIFRLISLFEFAKNDFIVSGSMLDLENKNFLYEAGSRYSQEYFKIASDPLKEGLNLGKASSLNELLIEEAPDYGALFFLSFPLRVINECGLLMPFFIHSDDVDFGLRAKGITGIPIVSFPGIAIWHKPFHGKYSAFQQYYFIRNYLITNAIHRDFSYYYSVKCLSIKLILTLFGFDIAGARAILKGFSDYLLGPDFIRNNPSYRLHDELLVFAKAESDFRELNRNFNLKYKNRIFRRFMRLVKLMALDNFAALRIMARWLFMVALSPKRWSKVGMEWKKSAKDMCSIAFWREYLNLRNTK